MIAYEKIWYIDIVLERLFNMSYKFSEKMDHLKPSVIREILKYSSDPAVIPFSAGNPAPEAFPVEKIQAISANILAKEPIAALQYSITEGYPKLIEAVTNDLKNRLHIGADTDRVIITSGAQQGIDLTVKSFCSKGDVIICESPSFVGSLNAFKASEATLVGVPMDEDGMNMEQLEDALKANPTAKLIYTIPNFQNPSGITMSMEKRRKMYQLAKQYGVCIIEDNPYGDLRFAGEDVPAIKTLDEDGIVIYCGSFSKVLSPGLRVGFVCANADIIQKITVLKQTNDVHTNILAQMVAYHFMTECDFVGHLENLRKIYKHKAELMLSEMDKHFSKNVTWTIPQGGLFLWCTLPEDQDMLAFCQDAVKNHKVAVVPGNAFMTSDDVPTTSFRMNYSTPTDEQIIAGVKILGDLMK